MNLKNTENSPLASEACEACRVDAPRVPATEIPKLLTAIPEWELHQVDGVAQLTRSYPFDNFVSAIAFANRVCELAEAADHHPSLLVEWGNVTVTWWTHKIGGLHRNDFIMAARTDQIF